MSNRQDKRKTIGNTPRCECGKRQYTKDNARRNAREKALDFYRCPFARAIWHVGHPVERPITSREEGRAVAAKRQARIERMRGEM